MKNEGGRMSWIPMALRISFHDCVSGCNGFVDIKNENNRGIGPLLRPLNWLWKKEVKGKKFYGLSFSFADFLAYSGCRASYLSSIQTLPNEPTLTVPKIEFKFCRVDASESENKEIFEESIKGWSGTSGTKNFFAENFKEFTTKDIVAIMGAHTLGNACKANSGFTKAWVAHAYTILIQNTTKI